jgi:hypothetical protein
MEQRDVMAEQREIMINSERARLSARTENRDDPPEHNLLIWISINRLSYLFDALNTVLI